MDAPTLAITILGFIFISRFFIVYRVLSLPWKIPTTVMLCLSIGNIPLMLYTYTLVLKSSPLDFITIAIASACFFILVVYLIKTARNCWLDLIQGEKFYEGTISRTSSFQRQSRHTDLIKLDDLSSEKKIILDVPMSKYNSYYVKNHKLKVRVIYLHWLG